MRHAGLKKKECGECKEQVDCGWNEEKFRRHELACAKQKKPKKKRKKEQRPRPVVARHTEDQKTKILETFNKLHEENPQLGAEYLEKSKVSLEQAKLWEKRPFKKRKLSERSHGAGVRAPDKRVVTPDMHDELKMLLRVCRGPPPKGHPLEDRQPLATEEYLEDNGHRTCLKYEDLANWLYSDNRFDHVFAEQEKKTNRPNFKVTWKIVYNRVVRWCTDNKVALKTPGQKTKNKELIAQRCLGTLQKIQRVRTEKGVGVATFCNLDETALRLLALTLKTLDYKGQECLVDPEQLSKFTLSMVCIWYAATGETDFLVLCGGGADNSISKWQKFGDIWFLTTPSKMMRKLSYAEVLNFALSKAPFEVNLLDDIHGGHGGRN